MLQDDVIVGINGRIVDLYDGILYIVVNELDTLDKIGDEPGDEPSDEPGDERYDKPGDESGDKFGDESSEPDEVADNV